MAMKWTIQIDTAISFSKAMENNNDLALLCSGALKNGAFNDEDVQKIQTALWRLLGQRTERFTMGESGSVPVETAEELLRSICFSVGLHLESVGDISLLKTENIEELLKASWRTLEAKIAEGKELLQHAVSSAPAIENRSYADTLKEITTFFKKYDYRFFAHDIPGSIDYQLCHAVPANLLGVEYINEYLRRLIVENEFCIHFSPETMMVLLQSYCRDYKELLINIFEPVAINAMGLALLGKDVLALDISDADRDQLRSNFKKWTDQEAHDVLYKAVTQICHQLQIKNEAICLYLQQTAMALSARIKAVSGRLDGIFLSLFRAKRSCVPAVQYVDGAPMDDEKLRRLITEINDCRFVSDKIAIVKLEVHSLRDLVEILHVCFWGDDCARLFEELSSMELCLLRAYLEGKPEAWQSNFGWEKYFESD